MPYFIGIHTHHHSRAQTPYLVMGPSDQPQFRGGTSESLTLIENRIPAGWNVVRNGMEFVGIGRKQLESEDLCYESKENCWLESAGID